MAPPDRMEKELLALGKKESDFLRLRRKRLGIDDFINIKVIGKGGFGEVRKNKNNLYIYIYYFFFSNYNLFI